MSGHETSLNKKKHRPKSHKNGVGVQQYGKGRSSKHSFEVIGAGKAKKDYQRRCDRNPQIKAVAPTSRLRSYVHRRVSTSCQVPGSSRSTVKRTPRIVLQTFWLN